MDIYMLPPGHIQMRKWNVINIKTLGTFHIAGYEISARRWRVSTEILELDPDNLTAKTRSGSHYSFTEPRGEMHSSVLKVLNTNEQGYSIATEEELNQFKPQKLMREAMNTKLTETLFNDCPLIFRPNSDGTQTIVNYREFECGDGWFSIIHELSLKIEGIAVQMHQNGTPLAGLPHVRQVKEKFGDLRFYMDNGTEDSQELIDQARLKASVTCEFCGSPGQKQENNNGLLMVVCADCVKRN